MAIRDLSKKPFVIDRDNKISVGLDLPIRRAQSDTGWFATSKTTLTAVKNNIKSLLLTQKGERLMQPNLGMNLRKYLFEPVTPDTQILIENDIVDTFAFWLPFVQLTGLEVSLKEGDTNQINISVVFNIIKDPTSSDSVQVSIGE